MTETELAIEINKLSRALFDLELQARSCKKPYMPTAYEVGMMMHTLREIRECVNSFEASIHNHLHNN